MPQYHFATVRKGIHMELRSAARIAAFLVALPLLVLSQSDRGTITGSISDEGAAVIPGAKLTVRNTQTGAVLETVTTTTGNFTLAQLPVGDYDLSVEAPGFKRFKQTGLRIQVA